MQFGDLKFYFGTSSGSGKKALRQMEEPDHLVNYISEKNGVYDGVESVFVDSGGYSFMKGYGEYADDEEEYLDYVVDVDADYFALRDYPCEPDLLEELGREVQQHQEWGLDKHILMTDMIEDRDIDSKPLSVIQGWEVEDYVDCIDMYKDHGIPMDNLGIGSICRRGATMDIRDVIHTVSDEVDTEHLHTFGVKIDVLRDETINCIVDSTDSSSFYFRNPHRGKLDSAWREICFAYLDFVERLKKAERELEMEEEEGKSVMEF